MVPPELLLIISLGMVIWGLAQADRSSWIPKFHIMKKYDRGHVGAGVFLAGLLIFVMSIARILVFKV